MDMRNPGVILYRPWLSYITALEFLFFRAYKCFMESKKARCVFSLMSLVFRIAWSNILIAFLKLGF